MLDTSPEALYREIESAEGYRDKQLRAVNRLIEQYHGPVFKGKDETSWENWPENHSYETISLLTPRLAYDNPRVVCKSRRPIRGQVQAKAIEHGLNRWIKDEQLRSLMIRIAVDMQFCWGVTMVVNEPMRHPSGAQSNGFRWCKVYRIPFRRFVLDPVCLWFGEARWMGHLFERDADDLKQYAKDNPDAGWDIEAVEQCGSLTSAEQLKEPSQAKNVRRNRIIGYEVWVPEVELPESPGPEAGFHGTIYTIAAANGRGVQLRKPRPYYGSKRGPYSLYGCYPVPDVALPLSPLVATAGQSEELNAYARAAQKSASEYRRIVLVDAGNETLKQKLSTAKDSMVIPVKGLIKDAIIPVELGGITAQQVQILGMLRERLNRASGLSDAARGNTSSGATATADSIAAESSATKHAFVKQQFEDGVRDTLMKVAEHMYYDDQIVFPLGEEALKDFPDMMEPGFQGGMHMDGSGLTFEDLELEIDPYSMPFMTDGLMQQRLMGQVELIGNLAPIMPQTPWVKWDKVLGMAGDAFNNQELSDTIDTGVLGQVAGMQLQQQAEQSQPMYGQQAGVVRGGNGPASPSRNVQGGSPFGGGNVEKKGYDMGGMLSGGRK